MKKSDEIKKQIDDLLIKAEAIQNLASNANDGDGRELTADERKSWDEIMDKEGGQLAKLELDLKAAIQLEEEQARLRSVRSMLSTPETVFDRNGSGSATPAIPGNVRIVMPRLKAFKGNGSIDQAQRDAYDCSLWFKSILLRTSRPEMAQAARDKLISRRGNEWYATQNETAPTDGGYLVPPQFESAVIVFREQVGIARKLARVVPMSSDTWTTMKQTAGTTVYYPGEETKLTASSASFGRYTLTAKKRAILSYVSAELRDDAAVAVMDNLATDMAHQFALKEDQEFVAGDATSTYGGVLGVRSANIAATASVAQAATGNDTWPELTYADCALAMSKLADKYRGLQCSWLCSGPFKWQVFDRLTLAQGGAASDVMVNGVPTAAFAGYPIFVSDRMPTSTAAATVCALFGAFGNAVTLGDRAGIAVAVSEHYAFDTDQIAVRATTRYDIKVHEPGDTSTAGGIVGLKTAA